MSPAPPGTSRPKRSSADNWALGTAITTLAVGAVLVLVPAVWHIGTVFDQDPFEPRTVEETTNKTTEQTGTGALTKKEKTVSTKEADDGWIEAAVGESGQIMVRLGLVLFAAFLAGALVQRAIMGQFQLKLGPVELPVTQAVEDTSTRVAELSEKIDASNEVTADGLDALGRQIAAAKNRLDALEREHGRG